ncbi:hypothetical protein [Algoriphagus taiwanensis]|uniref:hypothetical protein n=1 Tax=Algoriphagus taiwanensis TaxID=1445656 RepID=UPI0030C73B30
MEALRALKARTVQVAPSGLFLSDLILGKAFHAFLLQDVPLALTLSDAGIGPSLPASGRPA